MGYDFCPEPAPRRCRRLCSDFWKRLYIFDGSIFA